MTAIYRFPWELSVAQLSWKLDIKQALTDPPMSDAVRAQILSNGRWRTTFGVQNQSRGDAPKLETFLRNVGGYANRFKLPHFAKMYPQGSSAVQCPELVGAPLFATGTVPYTLVHTAGNTRVTSIGIFKLVSDGAGIITTATLPVVVLANTAYVARTYVELGTATPSFIVGTTSGGNDLFDSGAIAASGYSEAYFNSGAHTTVYISFKIAASAVAGVYSQFGWLSCHRPLLVSVANPSGNKISCNNAPINLNGFLLSGDLIEIANHIYEVKDDVDSDAAGNVVLRVNPVLRSTTFPVNQPVITQVPSMVCLLASPLAQDTQPGIVSNFSLEAIEDLLS